MIKILTKNSVDNTNINGACLSFFNAGQKNGIIKGALSSGEFYIATSNTIALTSCFMLIGGHQILMNETYSYSFSSSPISATRYSLIADLVVDSNGVPSFNFIIQLASTNLVKDNLYSNENGSGHFQVEIGNFTLTTNGKIEDLVKTIDNITGGMTVKGQYVNIGIVTTTMVSSGINANVDVNNRVVDDEVYTDFHFTIPETAGTAININGSQVGSIDFLSDPQKQINSVANNLGYYDTIIANDDGSYTITRQTGYANMSPLLYKHGHYTRTQNGGGYGADTGVHDFPIINDNSFINNLLAVRTSSEIYYGGQIGISIYQNGKCWMNLGDDYTSNEQYRAYLATNNIYIQYKLATATTEKVEKNHFARYNERFILEHNKTEADRSANLGYFADREGRYWRTTQDDITSIVNSLPLGTYTFSFDITVLSIDSGYSLNDCFVWFQIVGGQYTGDGIYKDCRFSSLNDTKRFSLTFNKENYNNYIVRLWGIGNHNGGNHGSIRCSNIALNEGTTALPYQPYEGKVIHEGNLKTINDQSIVGAGNISITEGLFTLVGKNVDTLTISENGTYFITTTYAEPIYVSEKSDIDFYGSTIISTVDMSGDYPRITISGVAHALPSTTATLMTSGRMNVYKLG